MEKEIIGAVGASPEVEEFVAQVTGSALGEIGGWFGDIVRLRRLEWSLRACEKAAKKLEKRGVSAREIRFNVLLPLLDAAANESDEDMAERWASLLASAADPTAPVVPPSFPEILRQLSPLDARILDFVARYRVNSKLEDLNPSPASDANADRFQPLTAGWIRTTVAPDVTVNELYLSLDNLVRLRLLDFVSGSADGLHRRVLVTVSGEALVDACGGPV